MTYDKHDFEGFTNGQSITVGNSNVGGCPAFTVATGGTRVADNTVYMHGTMSANISALSGATSILGWNDQNDAAAVFRGYIRFTALPSATVDIVQVRRAAGNGGSIQLRTDGKLNIINRAGSGVHTSTALSINTWYRIEIRFIAGTGTTDGTIQFALYTGDSTSASDTYFADPSSGTGTNCGTDNFVGFYFGKLTAITSTFAINVDDVAYQPGRTTLLGPLVGDSNLTYTVSKFYRINFSGSVGTLAVTQPSGTTMPITMISSTVYEVGETDHPDPLTLQFAAAGDGPPAIDTVTIPPTNLATYRRLRKGGTGSNRDDWL